MLSTSAIIILATLLTALVSFALSVKNGKAIQEVHLTLNSRLSELLKVTAAASHAVGKEEGMAQQKASSEPNTLG